VKAFQTHANKDAKMHALEVAIAVERFGVAHHGELPMRVEDLVPQFLPVVPMDPFDGKPMRLKKTSPGYVIYSVGFDGADSGGLGDDQGITVAR